MIRDEIYGQKLACTDILVAVNSQQVWLLEIHRDYDVDIKYKSETNEGKKSIITFMPRLQC